MKTMGPGFSDTARGIWKWVLGDMPLAPASTSQAKKAQRRRISGTRRDRALTRSPAPDPIAKAWEWIIGEQPLNVKGPDAQKEKKTRDSKGGKSKDGAGHKVLEWVMGDQPLGGTKKKKAKPSKTPESGKVKETGKSPKSMKKPKPKVGPLTEEGSETELHADDGAHFDNSRPSDTESLLHTRQGQDMGHHSDHEGLDTISSFSEPPGDEHSDAEHEFPPPTYSNFAAGSSVRSSEAWEKESASTTASTKTTNTTAQIISRRGL
ncbi:hypothetical protein G7Y79_00007g022760 [Physcia stellaris]|nr:hypothetical protein G7Y79_00007g022760 [Physcia stellaris]